MSDVVASSAGGITLNDLPRTWDLLAAQLAALKAAWEAGGPEPVLAAFVTAPDLPHRRLLLTELIKADLALRRAAGRRRRGIEEYLAEFPELRERGPLSVLLFEDFYLRKQAGEAVAPEDYYGRFPEAADELALLLSDDATAPGSHPPPRPGLDALDAGQELDDFELLRPLGKGSFARVFLARQQSLQRLVALKISTALGVEAQALAQLDHPNIVHVFDRRLMPERGLMLLYMTYVPGGTLQQVLDEVRDIPPAQRSGQHLLEAIDRARPEGIDRDEEARRSWSLRGRLARMTWPQLVCWIGARLAEALDYAHRRGILHRDVKPANVLLTAEGMPQLADFNVGSSQLARGDEVLFGGSLGFMAPEHLEAFDPRHPRTADSLDGRADLFSLGVTLWELLTGERPFALDRVEGTASEALAALARDRRAGIAPERLRAAAALAPEEMIAALRRALAPEPADRFARPLELARALERCQEPAARKLLRTAPTGWLASMRRFPVAWLLTAGILPSLLASVFNVAYNHAAVIAFYPEAEVYFQGLIPIINAIFFLLGIWLVLRRARPTTRAVRARAHGQPSPPAGPEVRRRALSLPAEAALIVVGCWAVAGAVWPLVLNGFVRRLTVEDHLQFLASLIMCGAVAAVYTYFLVAVLAVRAFLPALWDNPLPEDGHSLRRAQRQFPLFLGLAFAIPFVGIALVSFLQAPAPAAVLAMRTLSAAGLVGALLILVLERRLRGDLDVLQATLEDE